MKKYLILGLFIYTFSLSIKQLKANDYAPYTPIVMHVEPESQKVDVGGSATWYVTADGALPLSYQWKRDGKDIAGAMATKFSIPSVKSTDAGIYTCQVKNKFGEISTKPLILAIKTNLKEASKIKTEKKDKNAAASK